MSADNGGTGFIVDIVRATTRGSLVPIPPKEPPKKNQRKVEDPRDSALWLAENELMKVRILFSDSVNGKIIGVIAVTSINSRKVQNFVDRQVRRHFFSFLNGFLN